MNELGTRQQTAMRERAMACLELETWQRFLRVIVAGGVAIVWPLFLLGCQSTGKPASAQFASVEIQGNTPGQIRDVAVDVFKEHQYQVIRSSPSDMVFEKEGTGWDNVAYGNWMGEGVWVRVKASIVPVAEGTFRLQCNAFMVRDRSGATEEEVKLTNLQGRSYQKLLEEIYQRFHSQWPAVK